MAANLSWGDSSNLTQPINETKPNKVLNPEGEDPVVICQVSSVSQFTVNVRVGEKPVTAVVDTAAQVTIISDNVYQSLTHKPTVIRRVQLRAAGRDMAMQGLVVGPVKLKIGDSWYEENVHVAPIDQEMLLGFDLLRNRQAVLDMGRGVLLFDGMEITMDVGKAWGSPVVARVSVDKRRVIPPHSVARVKCTMSQSLPEYVVEPIGNQRFLMPRVVRSSGSEPIVCLLNPSDRYRVVTKGMEIGRAYPVAEIMINSEEPVRVQEVREPEVVELPPMEAEINDSAGPQIPEHLRALYHDAAPSLSKDEQLQLAQLLIEFQEVFAKDDFDLGNFTAVEHVIDTGDARPVKHRIRRTPACFAGEEEAHLKKMLEAGVIQESTSDWASAPVLIKKRDGGVRWCIDYRALNDVTVKDLYPLPLIEDCLDVVAGSLLFSKLDANSAYWQVKVREEDRKKTAFITKYGLYEHVRMGFGLTGAPGTYARAMNLVLRGLTWKTVLAFLDDIIVLGNCFSEHLKNLREVLQRFKDYGLKLKPRKCALFKQEVEFLGRKVGNNKLAITESDIQVVRDWPVPTSAKQVERFMGLANYHRGFIKDFSKLATPLYAVTGKHNFQWTEEQDDAFNELKRALSEPPVLALPNQQDQFVLDTDASDKAIGGVLSQVQAGKEQVIAYGSYALTKEQRRYCVTRKELLAVVRFTRQFRHYLLGRPFIVRTDHASLRWLTRFREPQGQLARWLEELSQYNMVLQYRAGRDHGNADALSRLPHDEQCLHFHDGARLGELPCGGCKYCAKAQQSWGSFQDSVDDVVLLVSGNGLNSNESIPGHQGKALHGKAVPMTDHHVESLDSAIGGPRSTPMLVTDYGTGPVNHGSALFITHGYAKDEIKPLLVDLGGDVQRNGPALVYGDTPTWLPEDPVDQADVTKLGQAVDSIPWSLQEMDECDLAEVHVVTRHTAKVKAQVGPSGSDLGKGGTVGSGDIPQSNTGQNQKPEPLQNNTSWGFSISDLQDAQSKDEDLVLVREWFISQREPDQSVLFRASPAAKYYWLNRQKIELIDGVLYESAVKTGDKLLILPQTLHETAIALHHDLPSSGHQGIQRTKERMREKFAWYGLSKDVANYVSGCATCNQNKKSSRLGKRSMMEYQAGAPMERVHVDFLGPLPRTAQGNEYVLMVVDQFSKWVECIPLPSQSAGDTARALVNGFFSRFGTPFQVFSDQGRNFDSKLFGELCKLLQIHKTRTTPYRPSANGQVERYNRTLMDAVRCFIGKSQNQWDVHIQQIAGALRSSVNRMTGFTANMLMLGREVNTPADIMFPHVSRELSSPSSYAQELTTKMQQAHKAARSIMKTASKRMKRNYDLRVLERNYGVGDVVYLLDTAALKGKCKKLCPPWKGPAVIVSKLTDFLFRVKLRNAVMVVNHDRLKPCHDRETPQWIKHWKAKPDESVTTAKGEDRTYCICRQPWQGRFMIQCDYCKEWYHGACVNISSADAVNIDVYKCQDCRKRKRDS